MLFILLNIRITLKNTMEGFLRSRLPGILKYKEFKNEFKN